MLKKKDIYHHEKHSKYLIQIHIVICCKYRYNLLTLFGEDIKQMIYEISNPDGWRIVEMECDKDHLHILADIRPTHSVKKLVSKIKGKTTIALWKKYPKELSRVIWGKHTFWSDGYFCVSIGNANPETIKRYIREQG